MQRHYFINLPPSRYSGRRYGKLRRRHALNSETEGRFGGGRVGSEVLGDEGVEVVFCSTENVSPGESFRRK